MLSINERPKQSNTDNLLWRREVLAGIVFRSGLEISRKEFECETGF